MKFDNNDFERYPFLLYGYITYFPMTYNLSNLLNLDTIWTEEGGLVIAKGNPETPKVFAYESPVSRQNAKTQTATIIDSKVTVNGKVIDNKNEPYPLLNFRDVTYFPLTWRFVVDEFGWNHLFDNTDGLYSPYGGLYIRADNFFYTMNGDSYISDSGESDGDYHGTHYVSVYNETHYIKGDFWISIKTTTSILGPTGWNLSIVKNGVETRPEGYFGYFQKDGPLFFIDGHLIITTYYTNPDPAPYGRDPRPVKVDIETGEIQ
jgi:hypothetical protein